MNEQWFGTVGVTLALSASLLNLIAQDWRKRVLALALQTIGVFVLCAQSLSLNLALVKFVEGWMAAAIIGTAMANFFPSRSTSSLSEEVSSPIASPPSALAFRLATAALVGVFLQEGATYLMSFFNGLRFTQAIAVMGLAGIGLLVLSFRSSTFSTTIGLITFLNGLEVLLAVIEPSVLLSGLLAGVVLCLAFLGAYLLYLEGETKSR